MPLPDSCTAHGRRHESMFQKKIKHAALLMLRPYFVDIVGKLAFEITALAPTEIIWCDSGHHLFIHDAATVHLKFKTRDRRAIEMPGQPRSGSTPPNDLVRKEGVKVMHRIDLRCSRVGPVDAERLHALFHLAEGGDGLFSHSDGTRLAVANEVFAAGNDEGCGRLARRHGERKRMEGRLTGSISGQTLTRATGLIVPSKSFQRESVVT